MPLRINLFCIAACVMACTAGPAFALTSLESITVIADSDMSLALSQIARDYSRRHQVIVNTSFNPGSAEGSKIAEGAAADILITPRQKWIDQLKTQGLIDIYSQSLVAKNRLALVGPPDSTLDAGLSKSFPTSALIRRMDGEPDFVIGNPEYLREGIYGKQALRSEGVLGDLEPYTLYIKDLGEMFDMVTKHGAYGLFFYSTVISRDDVRVIDVLPDSSHKPISYFAVVVAGENMDQARKFLAYLNSEPARRVFRANGFAAD